MTLTNARYSRPHGEIHIAVLSATVAIAVEMFTFLFGLVWSLGRMMFDLPDTAATYEAIVVGLATAILAVLMARMFYRHECEK